MVNLTIQGNVIGNRQYMEQTGRLHRQEDPGGPGVV